MLEPSVLELIEGDATIWEKEPLQQLSMKGELKAYKHHGFWQPMDTIREKQMLEQHWTEGNAPWKVW